MNYLLVGSGGFLGACSRHLISSYFNTFFYPWGTLCVNLIGCLVIGLLSVLFPKPEGQYYYWQIGFLGSFTTFSTFTQEVYIMIGSGMYLLALIYLLTSIIGGLLLFYLGKNWFFI